MKARAKRPKAVLRLKVNGKSIKPGRIPVPELLAILAQAQDAVNRQGEALRGRPGARPGPKPAAITESCTLELFAIGRGSAILSFANPDPAPSPQPPLDLDLGEELGHAAARTIAESLKSAGSKRRRASDTEMDGAVKQSLQAMGKLFTNGIDRVEWIVPKAGNKGVIRARFDQKVLDRLDHAPRGKARNEISMDGRLEMADFKMNDLKCLIHAPDGQRVVCTFSKDLEDDVYKALRGIARVTGLATYARPSNRLEKIELYTVKKLDPFLSSEGGFFESLSLADLTKVQGVDPTFDLRTLPNTWPEDEDVEAFLESIGER